MSVAIMEKLARGESPAVEAALVKDLGTGVEQFVPSTFMLTNEVLEGIIQAAWVLNWPNWITGVKHDKHRCPGHRPGRSSG